MEINLEKLLPETFSLIIFRILRWDIKYRILLYEYYTYKYHYYPELYACLILNFETKSYIIHELDKFSTLLKCYCLIGGCIILLVHLLLKI